MFATPAIAFHTVLSLIAIVSGACVMSALVKNRRPEHVHVAVPRHA